MVQIFSVMVTPFRRVLEICCGTHLSRCCCHQHRSTKSPAMKSMEIQVLPENCCSAVLHQVYVIGQWTTAQQYLFLFSDGEWVCKLLIQIQRNYGQVSQASETPTWRQQEWYNFDRSAMGSGEAAGSWKNQRNS